MGKKMELFVTQMLDLAVNRGSPSICSVHANLILKHTPQSSKKPSLTAAAHKKPPSQIQYLLPNYDYKQFFVVL